MRALRSTTARAVIISLTNRPGRAPATGPGREASASGAAAASRHSSRNGALVTPAIGASTTGGQIDSGPIDSGGAGGAAVSSTTSPVPVIATAP